jgi:hypothetical protein
MEIIGWLVGVLAIAVPVAWLLFRNWPPGGPPPAGNKDRM